MPQSKYRHQRNKQQQIQTKLIIGQQTAATQRRSREYTKQKGRSRQQKDTENMNNNKRPTG